MRTVGALRDAQRRNRKLRREKVQELMGLALDIQEANRLAGEIFDGEWSRLEQQAELNKAPGNRR